MSLYVLHERSNKIERERKEGRKGAGGEKREREIQTSNRAFVKVLHHEETWGKPFTKYQRLEICINIFKYLSIYASHKFLISP